MRESAAAKAKRLLCEARVDVTVRDRWQFIARVRGDSGLEHRVAWSSGNGWRCDCHASTYRSVCSHVIACQAIVIVNRTSVDR